VSCTFVPTAVIWYPICNRRCIDIDILTGIQDLYHPMCGVGEDMITAAEVMIVPEACGDLRGGMDTGRCRPDSKGEQAEEGDRIE
jgi:hypothetical protein